jgi:hypothetical protein
MAGNLPAPQKTWKTATVANALHGTVSEANQCDLWVAIKNQRKTWGHTVIGSGNLTTGGMDGVDRWSTFADVAGTRHCWIILQQPGSGAQDLIAHDGAGQNNWLFQHSPGGLFTGGAFDTYPTASDSSGSLYGGSAGSIFMGNGEEGSNPQYVCNMWASTDLTCCRMTFWIRPIPVVITPNAADNVDALGNWLFTNASFEHTYVGATFTLTGSAVAGTYTIQSVTDATHIKTTTIPAGAPLTFGVTATNSFQLGGKNFANMFYDVADDPTPGWAHPNYAMVERTVNNINEPSSAFQQCARLEWYVFDPPGLTGYFIGRGPHGTMTMWGTCEGSQNGAALKDLPRLMTGPNKISGTYRYGEGRSGLFFDMSFSDGGYHGKVFDFWWVQCRQAQILFNPGDTIPLAGNKEFVVIGDYMLPWSGTAFRTS